LNSLCSPRLYTTHHLSYQFSTISPLLNFIRSASNSAATMIQAYPPAYEPSDTIFRQHQLGNQDQNSQPLPTAKIPGHKYETSSYPFLSTQNDIPLDLTQRLERKLAEYNASTNIFKRWLFEILCWLISALCMGAIIGIYMEAKDKPMSQAGSFLTYTNILGKVASAALIVPTSEALGQLKWNWFQKSKAMWDFEIFDKASRSGTIRLIRKTYADFQSFRGPIGAVLLLYRTKGRSLAALGALLIVLLLAIDTFFQQVVDLPERRFLQAGSSIPRVAHYKNEYMLEYHQGYEEQGFDAFVFPSIRPFLYGNGTQPVPFGSGTRPDIPLACPTSSCTWPEYETLGVCSACTDASDLLQFKCMYTKIDWTTTHLGRVTPEATPNGTVCGYFYDTGDNNPLLMSGYILNETEGVRSPGETLLVRLLPFTNLDKTPVAGGSEKFKHVRNPVLDALIVSSPDSSSVHQHIPPITQECVLTWCVKTLQSEYESGTYSETVTDTYENTTVGPFPWTSEELPIIDGAISYWIWYNQDITIERNASAHNRSNAIISNETYTIDNRTTSYHTTIFDKIFPSYYTDFGLDGKTMLRYQDYWGGAYFRELPFNPWKAPNNVTHHLERLATSMTNAIRSIENAESLQGVAYSKETFVSVRWGWLAFPIVLLVLSLVFLAATIRKTSENDSAGIWKTSTMPTLIYSLPKESRSQFASPSTWGSGKGAPRKTRIKLLPNMGWRISGQSYLSRSPRLPSGERVPRGWI
jgi:hypothetical protein